MVEATTRVEALRSSMNQSGLLFQEGPDVGDWRPTRAGATTGEVAAYSNKSVEPAFDRLSIRFFEEGEVDDTYEHSQDTWYVECMDTATHLAPDERGDYEAYSWAEPETFTDREEMLERVIEIMVEVDENRPATEGDE